MLNVYLCWIECGWVDWDVCALGVYGDVIRVKIMFNKKDTALIQFADPTQAQIGNLEKF